MKIAKGEKITIEKVECTLTKVERYGMRGIMNGNAKVGDPEAIIPIYRLYYKYPNGKQNHTDTAINPNEIEVVCG